MVALTTTQGLCDHTEKRIFSPGASPLRAIRDLPLRQQRPPVAALPPDGAWDNNAGCFNMITCQ